MDRVLDTGRRRPGTDRRHF